jgi:methionyl aminopeptidase
MAIILKSTDEIRLMRESAEINALALGAVRRAIHPGVTTAELDRIAYDIITGHGGLPAFLGYPPGSPYPFPATITVAINEQLVHGIPGPRVLKEGEIVTIDCGTVYRDFVSDAAYTAAVGAIDEQAQRLLEVTEAALYKGIEASVDGNRFGDVSYAIQRYVESHGMNVVRNYGGHGVGRSMHESPHIPNWGRPGHGSRLRPGMTFALEPMVMLGSPDTHVLDDHWTVVTSDGRLCAHFEHTIAVTKNGPEILTKWE